jgi:hypothetical protein
LIVLGAPIGHGKGDAFLVAAAALLRSPVLARIECIEIDVMESSRKECLL